MVPFDAAATPAYAERVSKRERTGNHINAFDAQIAAICQKHHAQLLTRNVKDFEDTGLDVIDAWGGTR
jgi:hypothetical protein